MQAKMLKGIFPVLALLLGAAGFMAIQATAKHPDDKKELDTRPTIRVQSLQAEDHQVVLTSFGEVRPLETTQLAAQVAGEVTAWHPDFVAGGIVKRGAVLFSIEKDNYQAAVLQAEAEVTRAKAALIEEQAQAEVAKDEAARTPGVKRSELFLRKPQVLSAQAALKSAEAALKRALRDLDNCDIVAPYDALVISRQIGVGQFVTTGTPVAQLNNIESAEVVIPVAGFDNTFLPQQIRGVRTLVFEQGGGELTREAVIDRDLGVVDSATRMSNLVVKIDDPYATRSMHPVIKFGSYVQVSFAGKMLQNVYKLPQELVNNQTVWLLNEASELEPRKVKVVREEDAFFLIGEGLNDGDRLVLTVPEYPQKGMSVKLAEPAAEADGINPDTASAGQQL